MSTSTVPDIFEKPGVPFSTTADLYSTTQIGAALPTVETDSVVNPPMGGGAPSDEPLVIEFDSGNPIPAVSVVEDAPITPINLATHWSGGPPPRVYSVFSGTLPPGLVLNSSTGIVTGTGTTPQAASPVVFRGTDNAGNHANSNSVNFTITSAGDPVAIAIVNVTQAWWDFEENSGSSRIFNDSKGANHLTVLKNGNPAVGSFTADNSTASGLVGRAFAETTLGNTDLVAYIPRSNTNLDLPNSDWSIGGWFKLPIATAASARFLIGRIGNNVPPAIQAYMSHDGNTENIGCVASPDGGVQVPVVPPAVTLANWTLMVQTFDRANNLIRLRVRSVGAGSMSNVTAAFPLALYTAATLANFALFDGLSNNSGYFPGDRTPKGGQADSCFYMTKALSDAEFNLLYNGGLGLNYAQLLALAGM